MGPITALIASWAPRPAADLRRHDRRASITVPAPPTSPSRLAVWISTHPVPASLPAPWPRPPPGPEAGPDARRPGRMRPGLACSGADPVSFAPSAPATRVRVRPAAPACPIRCHTPRVDLFRAVICLLRPVVPVAGRSGASARMASSRRSPHRWPVGASVSLSWAVAPCASIRAPTSPTPSDQPSGGSGCAPKVPARQTAARGQAADRLGGDPTGARAGGTPPHRCFGGPLAGDGAEQRRDRPAGAMDGGASSRAAPVRHCRRWMGIRPAIRPTPSRRASSAHGWDHMGGSALNRVLRARTRAVACRLAGPGTRAS